MVHITHTTDSDDHADRVWDVITDLEGYRTWNPFLVAGEGTFRDGERIRLTMRPGGRTMRFAPRVKEVREGQLIRWVGRAGIPGLVDGEHVLELARTGDHTCRFTQSERFSGAIRPSLLLLGVASTVAAIVLAARHDLPAVSVLIPAILPDLAFLAAIGQPHAPGQLPSRAVPLYNALHHPAGPGAMLVTTLLTEAPPLWLVVALAWLAHVSIDRGLGYGLRGRDGWPRG